MTILPTITERRYQFMNEDSPNINEPESVPVDQPAIVEDSQKVNEADKWLEFAQKQNKVLETIAQAIPKPEPKQPDIQVSEPELVRPDPDKYQFGTYDQKYIDDLTSYKAKIEVKSFADQQKMEVLKQQQEAAYQATINRIQQAESEFSKTATNYEAVKAKVLADPVVGTNPGISEIVLDSDIPAELIHYLGTNLEEARAIGALSPMKAAIKLGVIEERLKAGKGNTAKVSNAPNPINPIDNSGAAVQSVDLSNIKDYETYKQARARQRAA